MAIARTVAHKKNTTNQRNDERMMKKEKLFIMLTLLAMGIGSLSAKAKSDWTTVSNGAQWTDNNGNVVHAHGAGFLKVGDTWYMIGEDRGMPSFPDVNMYSSKDLQNWRFERKIIRNGVTHPSLGKERFIERPKLMYCEKTKKYVVWCHWEARNYGASEAAVFYCDSVNGDYTFHWAGRPLGVKSRDCNVFVDNDGTAYFISTIEENQHLGLFKLSDDYLSAESYTELFKRQSREAPAIIRIDDTYFMMFSACTGWAPNQASYSYSKSLTSGWSERKNIGNSIAYDTQAASILTINGTQSTSYLYVGDRWQDPDLPSSKTIIFPISFSGTDIIFDYKPLFDINYSTGQTRETSRSRYINKSKWKVIASDNHNITIDMNKLTEISGFICTPHNNHSPNDIIREYDFQVSRDNKTWQTVSASAWLPYHAEVLFSPVKARYIKIVSPKGKASSIAELDVVKAQK